MKILISLCVILLCPSIAFSQPSPAMGYESNIVQCPTRYRCQCLIVFLNTDENGFVVEPRSINENAYQKVVVDVEIPGTDEAEITNKCKEICKADRLRRGTYLPLPLWIKFWAFKEEPEEPNAQLCSYKAAQTIGEGLSE